jgi:hypothetical protein
MVGRSKWGRQASDLSPHNTFHEVEYHGSSYGLSDACLDFDQTRSAAPIREQLFDHAHPAIDSDVSGTSIVKVALGKVF